MNIVENKNTNKRTALFLFASICFLIVLFSFLQVLDYSLVKKLELGTVYHNNKIDWDIETIKIDRSFTSISGWAIIVGKVQSNFKIDILLENIYSNEVYSIPTQTDSREDLNEIYDDNFDYSNNGFVARVNNRIISLDKSSYNIYIRYRINGDEYILKTDKIFASTGN